MIGFLSPSMLADALWLAVVGSPLLAAGLLAVPACRRVVTRLVPLTASPAIVVALWGDWVPPGSFDSVLLGARFGADPAARVFLLFTGVLWLLSGAYALGYLRDDSRRAKFFAFFLLAMGGNLGLIVAQDMASFYALFALMTFSSYGLVLHSGTDEARRASVVYIVMAIVGEAALFAAMVVLASAADTIVFSQVSFAMLPPATRQLATMLALIGLGVKVGVFGLHMWLPLAHPAAPTPASAVLSGAMIKAGVIGWMRFLPVGEVDFPGVGALLAGLGLLSAFVAVLFGLTQDNPKTVLAYSSVSQMGLVTVAVGLGMASRVAWPAAEVAVLLYVLHHGLAKSALFLGVGIADAPPRSAVWRGLMRAGLVIPAAALAGLPWTSGALAKAALKGAFEPVSASGFEAVVALLPWTAVGTSALMVRFLSLVWSSRDDHHGAVASAGMAVNWGVSVLLSAVVIWFWPAWLVAPFRAKTLAAGPVWMAAWPALVGISLAAVVGASPMLRGLFQRPLVPAGDLLYVLLRVASAAASAVAGPVSGLCRAAERARTIWGEVAGKWYFAAGGK